MIRIDALWLATGPVDMRSGADSLLARVVQVFGAAQAHHGYLFANARATRIKLAGARRFRRMVCRPAFESGTLCVAA